MSRFLAEDLPEVDLVELEAHVEWCRSCQQTLDILTQDPVIRPQTCGGLITPSADSHGESLKSTPSSWEAATPLPVWPLIRHASTAAVLLSPPQGPGELGRIAGYRVLKVLGAGGMGIVYQAEDVQLGRLVALKVMRPDITNEAGVNARFLREARTCAALKHDHVITIYQVGEERGIPYMTMELLEGMTLEQWLESGKPLSLAQILRIGREAASGLAAAHAKGLVHRDIKPGNLWLDQDNGRVKILDFGLARPQKEDAHLTQEGYILGTPSYMAPEQVRGEAVDERCDLFSLGIVLYRLCTGNLPFQGKTTLGALSSLAVDQPRPVHDCISTVPPKLSELIDRMLAKQPDRRPPSAQAVVEAIQAIEQIQPPVAVSSPDPSIKDLAMATPEPQKFPEEYHPTSGETPQPVVSVSAEAQQRRASTRKTVLLRVVTFLLAGALLAAIILIVRKKDGSETRIELPDEAGVDVQKDGQNVARIAANAEPPEIEQLAVIQWLMEEKGHKQIAVEKDGQVLKLTSLPAVPFKLRKLNLHPTLVAGLTTEELKRLDVLVDIEVLELYGQPLTDETLAHLVPLTNLRRLDLYGTKVTPAAVQTLRRFPKLEELRGSFGSEEWLKGLTQLPELRKLMLYRTTLSDQSLRWIKDFPKLDQLTLASTKVSEAGLLWLKEAKQLRLLDDLWKDVPKETVEKLAESMFWCEIRHSQGTRNSVIYNQGKAGQGRERQ